MEQEENWNLTRTSEFIDKSDEVIKDAYELRCLDEYIRRKVIHCHCIDGTDFKII